MTTIDATALSRALDNLPDHYPGPGGVAGIVHEGRVIEARAWGFADLDRAQAMTEGTRLPLCSISKQFTCAAMLGALDDPDRLDRRVTDYLPRFAGPLPSVRQLAANQSGLRDYWALTVLHGARAEQTFAQGDALPLIARMRSGHFAPGTSYSYCNANFRILSEIVESETGRPLAELYRRLILEPAGMETAELTPDTRTPLDGVVGYEGCPERGYIPADNGIWWIGDAGLSASLTDMLAYEAWIDATRDDPAGLYRRLSAPPRFADGSPARYGFGLSHQRIGPWEAAGHGGALRGFRMNRIHVPGARLSAVVLFNHEGDAHGAAAGLLRAALGVAAPAPGHIADDWAGAWLCPQTGLSLRIEPLRAGGRLHYATSPEGLRDLGGGRIGHDACTLARDGGTLTMTRPAEALKSTLIALDTARPGRAEEIVGRYASDETGSEMEIAAHGGGLSVTFDGMLGRGRPERLHPLAADVWLMATRRSMDAPAPGEWTLRILRGADGQPHEVELGCWLARRIAWRRA